VYASQPANQQAGSAILKFILAAPSGEAVIDCLIQNVSLLGFVNLIFFIELP
jgi:hypothetical protein